MKIKEFIVIFKKRVEKLYGTGSGGIICGIKDIHILKSFEHTYLINVAIFLTTKEYNKKYSKDIVIVPESGGRSPTDFILKDYSNRKVELAIEHENLRGRIFKNYDKLAKNKEAKERLLICYIYDKDNFEDKFKKIKIHKHKNNIKKKIHILMAYKGEKRHLSYASDYKYRLI